MTIYTPTVPAIHTTKSAPGPRGWPLLGVLPAMQRAPFTYLVSLPQRYGPVVRLQLGPRLFYLISQPADVMHVLQDNQRAYTRGYDVLYPLMGQGLFTAEGAHWLRQRRLLQPAFHRQQLAGLVDQITSCVTALLERWQQRDKPTQPLNMEAEMTRLTQTVIFKTMFSADIDADLPVVGAAFDATLAYLQSALFLPVTLPLWLPIPAHRHFLRGRQVLDDIVYRLIARRRQSGDSPNDLLSMLLQARDADSGEGMSDRQIRDEAVTMFFAGHETTASTLTWVWYLLSKHPTVARQVEQEVATVLGDRTPTFADLPNLVYIRRVIDETLRLYPPAWMFWRTAAVDDRIDNYTIPAGAKVLLSPYVTHRQPSAWANPEGFDPDRFRPEQISERPRFAYFPFGGGPHQCIGNHLAIMEAQIAIAMLTQAYHLHLQPGHPPVTGQLTPTLRPYPGVWMNVERKIGV